MNDSGSTVEVRIKPRVSSCRLEKYLLERFPFVEVNVASLKELNSYEDRNYYFKGILDAKVSGGKADSEVPNIFDEFVVKIYNQEDSNEPAIVDAQIKALLHLKEENINVKIPTEVFPRPHQQSPDLEQKFAFIEWTMIVAKKSIVRVLSFVPGKMFEEEESTKRRLYNLGEMLGKLDMALKTFYDPSLVRTFTWNLKQGGDVIRRFNEFVESPEKEMIRDVLDRFEHMVRTVNGLRESVIHNDANDNNVLICGSGDDPDALGIIDFGDLVYTWTVSEVAIAMAYVIINSQTKQEDAISYAMNVLAGYESVIKLNEGERKALPILICARMSVSITVAARGLKDDPNNEYLKIHAIPARKALRLMLSIDPVQFWQKYRKISNGKPWESN